MPENNLDWIKGFLLDFSLSDGLSKSVISTKRKLSQMHGIFTDEKAFNNMVVSDNPMVYEFYEIGTPENAGDIAFGTSIIYHGKIGNEYFMTKGHFHTILETAEVYYTLSGEGGMLIENPEGETVYYPLIAGKAVYVPQRFAHRSINTGNVPLVSFFAFRGDAGHNYATIETKGFRKLVIQGISGKPELIDNPKWGTICP